LVVVDISLGRRPLEGIGKAVEEPKVAQMSCVIEQRLVVAPAAGGDLLASLGFAAEDAGQTAVGVCEVPSRGHLPDH
jgi:hypothetical protein